MCGIFGIYSFSNKDVARKIYYGLYALQHRGQEGAGIVVSDGTEFHSHKGLGLVPEVFNNENINLLKGYIGIGHVRYSTTGGSVIENCQPFIVNSSLGNLAIAHNGDIVNSHIIKKELEKQGHIFTSSTDSEVLAHLIVKELLKTKDIIQSISNVSKDLIGAYSLIILYNNTLIAVRDPKGFKPLCIGKDDDNYYISSESCGLDVVDAELVRDVNPGEIVTINKDGIESCYVSDNISPKNASTCMFEYVYFARPDSVIDGISVYNVRRNIGKILAKEEPCDADIVSPVPDSGITSAIGYSEELDIPYYEGLIKNRYVGRTFILPTQEERNLAVRLKLNPVKSILKDKKVVLIDDSIVRGTTSKRIVDMVRKAGAKEVHLRIGSPKIISPCFYGIDMPTKEELIASSKSVDEIREFINADSLGYLSIEGLIKAIGRKNLCLACVSGNYPTDISLKFKK
ncbi:amidophosphoribosyltransferase [Methanothermococcus okinawensis]|uniref:Amidophosphoribosyltransferase n=1 Tax=Methanothermococcus okinawensis (strain DSM 14208 / JCM 11175 / IH1) TaxID=647113 RepID=F8ANN9_METOI|nr:amidophosphoribosyltransferase [Methanothermococcus okinawensis]AEH06237.1 amidophosphoribosyltransferase [Methanothermococcus okinawensis IH1]